MEQRIIHMVKNATITNAPKTSGAITTMQISSFQGQEVHNDRPLYQHFGFASVPPVGSQAITLSGMGLNNNRMIVGTHDINSYPKGLKAGEIQLHDNKKQSIYLKDGTYVQISGNNQVSILIGGTEVLTVEGNKISLKADVEITGSLKVSGDVQAGNISLEQHTHSVSGDITSTPK